jgi:nitroimidazol reductase NimA-like FMN-containing flavoprotein (pyridoxamine 5'-phosphate oxidase superfamily)
VVPVNYVVDDRDGTPTLVFLTAEGNKLLAAELHSAVALQIDELGDEAAWSVLVRGRLQHLGEAEEDQMEALSLRPWVPMLRYDLVELVPHAVTGRRFLIRHG